jgi:hypothetical protein
MLAATTTTTTSSTSSSSSLLKKKNLLHETEESIVALHNLREWAIVYNDFKDKNCDNDHVAEPVAVREWTAVDACCGKGCFSLLLSYLAGGVWAKDLGGLTRIILFDKDADIDWTHIDLANQKIREPYLDVWEGINLFDHDALVERFQDDVPTPLAMTGIHLCRNLGPACVGLANALGCEKVPYLCLAPCCLPLPNEFAANGLPRSSKMIIPIAAHETPLQRRVRLDSQRRHKAARRRAACYVCQANDHAVHECPRRSLAVNESEWTSLVKESLLLDATCWNCGLRGQIRDECHGAPIKRVPQATLAFFVSGVGNSNSPFETYCYTLSEHIQNASSIQIVDSGLISNSQNHADKKIGWNANRKSIFLVASRG